MDTQNEPTNQELRERIARGLGYEAYYDVAMGYWRLHNPDGNIVGQTFSKESDAYRFGTPNWPDDLNAAAVLLQEMDNYHLIWWAADKRWFVQDALGYVAGNNKNPARAICLAYVAMLEKRESDE